VKKCSVKNWILIALVAVWALGALGCKQGIGERCQVNEDCEEGICSNSEPRVCRTTNDNDAPIDASVPVAP
jgi:hypothetical protein